MEEQERRRPWGWPKYMGANSRETLSDSPMFSSKNIRCLEKITILVKIFFFSLGFDETFSNSKSWKWYQQVQQQGQKNTDISLYCWPQFKLPDASKLFILPTASPFTRTSKKQSQCFCPSLLLLLLCRSPLSRSFSTALPVSSLLLKCMANRSEKK